MCTVHRKLSPKAIELQQYLSAGELHGNLLKGIDNKTVKGHLISKFPFGIFKSSKKPTIFFQDFCPRFKIK